MDPRLILAETYIDFVPIRKFVIKFRPLVSIL